MVASRFIVLAKDRFDITSADEKTLDITKSGDIEAYFEKNTFDTVINFAAFTNVDAAEVQKGDEGGLVWKLNVEGPRSLAEVCFNKNIFLGALGIIGMIPLSSTGLIYLSMRDFKKKRAELLKILGFHPTIRKKNKAYR